MELNYDFVREILIEIAKSNHAGGPTAKELIDFAETKGFTYDELAYTLARLFEGSLVTKLPTPVGDSYKIAPSVGNLTWQGNEYLNSIRNQDIWTKTKDKLKQDGIKVAFDTVVSVASAIANHQLGLS
ncbi:DUF2513 domain-containing protein [Lactobacillus sp. ESL0681]|uniref:DUF2513 domain-containing protein n=1 Tax=Lactobacillus sp. ESL0681 TaxID=2983211 RepID=UPI0023F78F25|nr:DUF2513 domain-containing protein [Lactobacillus sp. ESL0681]WEV40321.1 DUF2513 domain-containing protein [Lactobacillus sp. ESL0681]